MTRQDTPNTHRVNALLHNLRGEAYRHRRNVMGATAPVPPPSTFRGPSLPLFFTNHTDLEDTSQHPPPVLPTSAEKVAGPSPPRSWLSSKLSPTPSATPEWRARILSLILKHCPAHSPALAVPQNPHLPSLFQLCLNKLLRDWGGIPPELFSDLPRHILREYIRYSVVHAPGLPWADLEAMWSLEGAGSVDGELIISGPSASAILPRLSHISPTVSNEWDAPSCATDPDPPPVTHTLILLNTGPLSWSVVSAFPPTLTRLALLNVSSVVLHRLPAQLPLIEVLDLSFNVWIGQSETWATRVEWHKWTHLEVLGLRECGLSERDRKALEGKVNSGRFNDVEIVL